MSRALETRDHATIRRWAEERDGHPARVGRTRGMLRIDFGEREDGFEPISWEEFFDLFDESGVVFVYSPARDSRFNKFVRDEDSRARGRSGRRRAGGGPHPRSTRSRSKSRSRTTSRKSGSKRSRTRRTRSSR